MRLMIPITISGMVLPPPQALFWANLPAVQICGPYLDFPNLPEMLPKRLRRKQGMVHTFLTVFKAYPKKFFLPDRYLRYSILSKATFSDHFLNINGYLAVRISLQCIKPTSMLLGSVYNLFTISLMNVMTLGSSL